MIEPVFKRIALSEKKMLLREIAHNKIALSVKGESTPKLFHLIAIQNDKDEVMLCHHSADSKHVNQAQKAVVNFPFKNERYYFQSELYFEAGWAVIKLNRDIFQLQRRTNARIEIPKDYNAAFILTQYDGKSYFIEFKVKDFSAGGLKIEITSEGPEVHEGKILKGSFRLGSRRPVDVEAEVRHVRKVERDGQIFQITGIKFLRVDKTMENRLLNFTMDLQQELFLKSRS